MRAIFSSAGQLFTTFKDIKGLNLGFALINGRYFSFVKFSHP
ncbi:MAG: hypothetical protein ACJAXN_001611 [Psychromonas sp.]|jgi:hypothetical protein